MEHEPMVVKNARIDSTMLGYEDHGGLTFMLQLDYGGSGQMFGGWGLDDSVPITGGPRRPTLATGAMIAALLDTLEVTCWEKLKGQQVRVRCNHYKVEAIGHFLHDKWCYPEKVFEGVRHG